MTCKKRLTVRTPEGACLKLYATNEIAAHFELKEKFKLACNKLADLEDKLENKTLIELPCKVGDTVYVVPSLCNFRLNIVNRQPENNRICEQKVHSLQMWNANEYCLWTCDGINLLLQRFYKETWFLTREEAEGKMKELKENARIK